MANTNKALWFALGGTALYIAYKQRSGSDDSADTSLDALAAAAKSPTDFVNTYYPFAVQSEADTGVPALFTIAQAGLESGWGKSAPGFNFFGAKAGSSWKGATQMELTWECGSTGDPVKDGITDTVIKIFPPGDANGNASCNTKGQYSYRVNALFRKYSSASDSFADHGAFLKNSTRYAAAFNTDTPEDFASAIADARYATAPDYKAIILKAIALVKTMQTL
jgi:flagellum-specific peptidoglycan hydrolase FlgJ